MFNVINRISRWNSSFKDLAVRLALLSTIASNAFAQTANTITGQNIATLEQPYLAAPYGCNKNRNWELVRFSTPAIQLGVTTFQTIELTLESGELSRQAAIKNKKIKALRIKSGGIQTKKILRLKQVVKALKTQKALLIATDKWCKEHNNNPHGTLTPSPTSGTPVGTPTAGSTPAPSIPFSMVQPIIQTQCMSCHGATWQNNQSWFITTARVVPGNLANSSLYTFLAGNQEGYLPAYMPKNLPEIPASEISTIRGWILTLGAPTPGPSASPTRTATHSRTPTITRTGTITRTPTRTSSPTITRTPTITASPTATATPIPATSTPTHTVAPTHTSTATRTVTGTATYTSTRTATPTITSSPTITLTPTISPTSTITATGTLPTRTPTGTNTVTLTPTRTYTPSRTATNTITPTHTSSATATVPTSTPTSTATSTFTPSRTATPTRTPTRTHTRTPTPTSTAVQGFSSVQPIIQNSCMNCHGPMGWQNNEAWFISSGRVVPANLVSSSLYTYLSNNPEGYAPAYMPKNLPALPATEIASIRNWILGLSTGNGFFACNPNTDQSATPIRRLSRTEYTNTLFDLLAVLGATEQATVLGTLSVPLSMIPDDQGGHNFDRQDSQLSTQHVDGFFETAVQVAKAVTQNSTRQQAFFGTCSTSTNATTLLNCAQTFISNFGLKALRRPISSAESNSYVALYNVNRGAQGFRDILTRFLLSPQFLYHVEVDGTPINGRSDYLQISNYELAARLSYHFWQTMPDTTLFTAASNNSINTNYAAILDQVFTDATYSRTKQTLREFYAQWLDLDSMPALNPSSSAAFGAFASGYNPDALEMMQEMQTFTDYYTWDSNGTFSDLLTSNASFATTSSLAQIYGVPIWQPGQALVHFPSGQRSGILSRAAKLISGSEETSPILRGVYIRREILCDVLSDPPPDIMDQVMPPPPNPLLTMRERVTQLTSPAQCSFCHSIINPLGFNYESLDSIGRSRSIETIYNADGSIANQLPIDAVAAPEITIGDASVSNGPAQTNQLINQSGKAHACFTRKYFRFAYRRFENDANDGCALSNLHTNLTNPGSSLRDMLKSLALQAEFRRRKIDP